MWLCVTQCGCMCVCGDCRVTVRFLLLCCVRFGYCTNTQVKIITVCDASVKDSELVEVITMQCVCYRSLLVFMYGY